MLLAANHDSFCHSVLSLSLVVAVGQSADQPTCKSSAISPRPSVGSEASSVTSFVTLSLGRDDQNRTKQGSQDCRLCPRCCHLGSYFKRPKSSPVRSLACNWYCCAQFIAKPKDASALRFSWAATSSNLGSWTNITSSMKPEVHNVSLRRQTGTSQGHR